MHNPGKKKTESVKSSANKQAMLSAGCVLLIVAAGMTVYECLKQTLWPSISIWESHFITILFSAILAALATFFFLRRQITLRLQLKEQDQLQSAIQTAGAISHEISQPLQFIIAQIEILLLRNEVDSATKSAIIKIFKEAQHMGDITHRLQRITKFTTREYVGDTRILDLEKSAAQGNDTAH